MRTVLMLSGGMDSALCLAMYPDDVALCVSFDYGQPHKIELEYAAEIAKHYGTEQMVITLPTLPKVDDVVFAGRNAVLLTHAAAIAQARVFDAVMIGCNADDAARFPDCRSWFLTELAAALSHTYGVGIRAPLLKYSKSNVIAECIRRKVPATWTCYAPSAGKPCGECYSCNTLKEKV